MIFFENLVFLFIIINIYICTADEFCNNKYCFNVTENPTSGQSSCSSGSWPLEFPDKEASDFFNSKADPNKLYEFNLKYESSSWEWTTRRRTSLSIEDLKDSSQWYACFKNKIFYAKYFNDEIFQFICEVNEGCAGNQDPSCFEVINPSNEGKTWSEAMNYCVERNKRLAVFEDDQVPKQLSDRLDSSKCYWIGLSKVRFTWPHYNKSLTYSSWLYGFPPHPLQSSGCFFVRNNKWEKHNCVEPSPLVCMNDVQQKSSSYSSSKFPSSKIFTTSQKSELSDSFSFSAFGIGLVVGLIICFFFVLLVLLFFFLYKKKKNLLNKKTEEEEIQYEEGTHVTSPDLEPKYATYSEENYSDLENQNNYYNYKK